MTPLIAQLPTNTTLHSVYDLPNTFVTGNTSPENGTAAYTYIETALDWIKSGKCSTLVTAPISKTSLQQAGYTHTGHTTLLKEKTNADNVSMAFFTNRLKTILTTVHIPLSKVPSLITNEALSKTLDNTIKMAQLLEIDSPKIALAGLNPHASEDGLFGTEEQDTLIPFVKDSQSDNYILEGPFPPDTIYHRAYKGDFDIVISLYHDQGLIPIKLLAFDEAVNMTLGLPFLRTSPDHGTAFDIAYTDQANPNSMIESLKLAIAYG